MIPDYSGAIAFALDQLRAKLLPGYTYHNVWHTEADVIPACLRLARLAGIGEPEQQLLAVAAAFHDIGYVVTAANHEIIGLRIAAQTLPDFGFTERAIEAIIGMILATRMPQSPRNELEALLADADLDVLGRPDFMVRNEALRQELAHFGQAVTLEKWVEGQLAFVQDHTYFTEAARTARDEMKAQNSQKLAARLQVLG